MILNDDWTMDFARAVIVSDSDDNENLLYCNNELIAKYKAISHKVNKMLADDERNVDYNGLFGALKSNRYSTICPHCGAPHNPKEARCEYCGGYMKEE